MRTIKSVLVLTLVLLGVSVARAEGVPDASRVISKLPEDHFQFGLAADGSEYLVEFYTVDSQNCLCILYSGYLGDYNYIKFGYPEPHTYINFPESLVYEGYHSGMYEPVGTVGEEYTVSKLSIILTPASLPDLEYVSIPKTVEKIENYWGNGVPARAFFNTYYEWEDYIENPVNSDPNGYYYSLYFHKHFANIFVDESNSNYSDIDGVLCDKSGKILYYHPPMHSESYTVPEGMTVDEYAFAYNQGLNSVKMSPNTEVSLCSFMYCINLKSADLSMINNTSIPDETFYDCISLEEIKLPQTLTEIGKQAFRRNCSLKSIELPDGFKSLNSGAFYEAGLESLHLPASIEYLANGSLYLKNPDFTVVIDATDPDKITVESPSYDIDKSGWRLYVPEGCKEKYEAADYWKDFGYIYEGEPGAVENIDAGNVRYKVNGDNIELSGINSNVPVVLYTVDGKCLFADTLSANTSIPVSAKGMLILKIANKTYKLVI